MTNFKKKVPELVQQEKVFRTQWNYVPSDGELNTLPSETIPHQSLSIPEVLSRWSRGLPISGAKVPEYHGEDLLPDLKKMDFAEIEELKNEVRLNMAMAKEKLDKEIIAYNKLENEKREKELKQRIERLEKSLQTTSAVPPTATTE